MPKAEQKPDGQSSLSERQSKFALQKVRSSKKPVAPTNEKFKKDAK